MLERSTWEEVCRSAKSVYGIADAMVHLEDWINLDYSSNSEVQPVTLVIPKLSLQSRCLTISWLCIGFLDPLWRTVSTL